MGSGRLELDKIVEGISQFKMEVGDVQILDVVSKWYTMKLEIRYIGLSGGEEKYIYELK